MSRHVIPAHNPQLTVTVGWDNPMGTFFAIVVKEVNQEERILLWLGGVEREVLRPEDMVEKLKPFADLNLAMLTTLNHDRAKQLDRGPTPLQRFGRSL